jgi:ribA/ribD-fused uncharacterized protein
MQERIYNINEVISFRKTTEAFGGLSNMASGYHLFVNDIIIPSAEHLYQAMRYPLYPNIQAEIIAQDNGMKAKMISNKYKSKYSRPDWDSIRIKIMRWVLEVKLSQNWEKFSELLISTGNKDIVEYSHKDKIWGVVLKSESQLVGVNALGRLLMELREKYTKNGDRLYCVDPVNIPAFLLYNFPIDRICDQAFYESYSLEYDLETEMV